MNDLPAVPQTALEAAGAAVTPTSLILTDPDIPWEEYEQLGAFLGQMNRACAWWVGDLIIYGEEFFGHRYAQIEDVIGLAPQTIANRVSVARHIPPNRRRASLPFGVHAEVAYLNPMERDRWLDRAELGAWTRAKLREEMRRAKGIEMDPVGDLAVTSKNELATMDAPSTDGAREERSVIGVPAAKGDFLGELVPGPHTCPHCGHSFYE